MPTTKTDYGILIFVVVVTLCMLAAVGYQLEDSAEHSAKMAARQVEADSEFRDREKRNAEMQRENEEMKHGLTLSFGAQLGVVYFHCTGDLASKEWLIAAYKNPGFLSALKTFNCATIKALGAPVKAARKEEP